MNRSSEKKRIKFLTAKKIVKFTGAPTILQLAIANDLPLNHSCGGMGSCTTCRIRVAAGLEKFDPPGEIEHEHIQRRGWEPELRLACQNAAKDGLTILIPE